VRFDQSIRNEVGGGTRILLTNVDKFQCHRAAILHHDGLYASLDSKQLAHRSKSDDICQQFNSDSECPNTSGRCKYRHTCRACGKGGHGAKACEGKK
jgi:hypothetical protein